jgi:hypothetical protein
MEGNMMDFGKLENLLAQVKKYIQMEESNMDIGTKESLLKKVRIFIVILI